MCCVQSVLKVQVRFFFLKTRIFNDDLIMRRCGHGCQQCQLNSWVQTHPPTAGRHTVLISPHRCTNTLTVYTRDPADWPRWGVKQITKPLASSPPPNRRGERSFRREKLFSGDVSDCRRLQRAKRFEWRSRSGGSFIVCEGHGTRDALNRFLHGHRRS